MILNAWWAKLVKKLVDQTPGIGELDEAHEAIKRSDRAYKDVEWAIETTSPDIDYVDKALQSNHFSVKVRLAFQSRRP